MYVGSKKPDEGGLPSTAIKAPSYGELIFSESDGEDSCFELIPDPADKKKKWFYLKHVTGMYVSKAPNDTLMLSGTEPGDLFKYKKRKKRIKCKPPPRKEFWYGDNPAPGTPVKVNVLDKARKPAFTFMVEKVK